MRRPRAPSRWIRLDSRPDDVANVIVAAMDGIKHAPGDNDEGMQLFMRLLRAAIS